MRPLTSVLYPDWGGRGLDSHKAFVVKYDMKEDLDLSYHYDNAEVTLNVCLGKTFTEGGLYFGDMKQVQSFSSSWKIFTCDKMEKFQSPCSAHFFWLLPPCRCPSVRQSARR